MNTVELSAEQMEALKETLQSINLMLQQEITAKQKRIDKQESEIDNLRFLHDEKNRTILQLNDQIAESKRKAEGNRQLVNKLLFDIERLQQDIEWYKRTYETRSLLGTIKEKLLKK